MHIVTANLGNERAKSNNKVIGVHEPEDTKRALPGLDPYSIFR